ncbi:tail fiber assembly protein [Desulfobaculum sp. SPO524]|uniref:tail fiber assembly protein n=1 Tax=Desulfobaculum sp. SPO524 TaxID=3378071 RepID=UPI003853F8E1
MILYSPSQNGFYAPALHGNNIPVDAVEITAAEHRALLDAQSRGKLIQPDANGRPVAVEPPPLPEPTPAQLATQARAERDRLMREVYDPAVMQLLRKRRVLSSASEDVAGIDAQLTEWDAYADVLEVVPDQPGFPNSIEWPEAPSDSVVSGAEGGGVSCESESEPATSEV